VLQDPTTWALGLAALAALRLEISVRLGRPTQQDTTPKEGGEDLD